MRDADRRLARRLHLWGALNRARGGANVMATRGRRKSSWVLVALALVVVVGWVSIVLFGSASSVR
jgi:hypothetical protein